MPKAVAPLLYRGLQRLLHRLPGGCDVRIHSVVALQPEQLRLPPRLPREIAVRWLTPADEPSLQQLRPAVGVPYRERFQIGHRCIGAFLRESDASRLIAFLWVLRGPARMPASFGCAWDLSATLAWLYDLYSSSGVVGAMPHLYQFLRQNPPGPHLTHWMGQHDLGNQRSRMAHLSLGFSARAQLWSLRCGRWLHISRAARSPHWRLHPQAAAIPLALFVAADPVSPAERQARGAAQPRQAPHQSMDPPAAPAELQLQCGCGSEVSFREGAAVCGACGRRLGSERDGFFELGAALPYWGELPQSDMQSLLQQAEGSGWRAAVRDRLPPRLADYVTGRARAAFRELLPVREGARLLSVGAGWGSIAAPLAGHYDVVALEGVCERARFIALRRDQDQLSHLTVIRGKMQQACLAPRQFDAIIANGVLEWSALEDLHDPPRQVQLRFLVRLRELLRPGGFIYVGIENRFGWPTLRGSIDHSGRRYTSVMPRFLAHQLCLRGRGFRAAGNAGYRTYTYSYRGYRRLFAEAGLQIEASWVSPGGYNCPTRLVPLHPDAIRFASRRRETPWPRAWLKAGAAQVWIWRWFGSDFAFLLRATAAVSRLSEEGSERIPAHA